MDITSARAQLTEMLADLDRTLGTLSEEKAGESSELSHYDQHPADIATDMSDADREVAVMEVSAGQREQVLAALARIENGTYGRCVDCGNELPAERLEARPEAARCVEDQAAFERRERLGETDSGSRRG